MNTRARFYSHLEGVTVTMPKFIVHLLLSELLITLTLLAVFVDGPNHSACAIGLAFKLALIVYQGNT